LISNSEIKLITGLHRKKYRSLHNLFIAEGEKLIGDLMDAGLEMTHFYTSKTLQKQTNFKAMASTPITERQMQKISVQKNPSGWLAVFKQPQRTSPNQASWVLALDDIQDPGNMGTILRLCDWFGITHLVCTQDTVEVFNPKVVQSSMGSIARVQMHYVALDQWLAQQSRPIFGAVLDGKPVGEVQWPDRGVLLMGNEGQGIRPERAKFITDHISITGALDKGAESLNVAMATGILLHQWHINQ
jgi:TrmH family RNA methyltransferase